MSIPDPRSLAWTRVAIPGTTNLRDLGGLTTSDGFRLSSGLLFRCDVLIAEESPFYSTWRPENADSLRALGLHTVIDLRSQLEADRKPSSWGDATGAHVLRVPIDEGAEGTDTHLLQAVLDGRQQRFDDVDLAEFYIGVLERRAPEFAAAVHELSLPGALPALVHCAAGKDRTGLLVALLLECLGVPRDTVVADYALTDVLRPDRVEAYAPQLRAAGINPNAVRTMYETPPWAMTMALEHMERQYGDAAGYLENGGGLAPADLDRLRAAVVVRD